MTPELAAQISRAIIRCLRLTNYTQLQCMRIVGKYFNITLRPAVKPTIKTPHWLDSAHTITWASFSFFLDSVSCFLGIVCVSLALAALCQKEKRQQPLSSASFLQRTMVVTDLCFLVMIACSSIVNSGYMHHVYQYASLHAKISHKFVQKILRSAQDCIEMIAVWLIVIITIDR